MERGREEATEELAGSEQDKDTVEPEAERRSALRRGVSWVLGRFRRRPSLLVLVPAVTAGLGVLVLLLMGEWVRYSASSRIYLTFDDVPQRTVAIVPGASVRPGGRPSAMLADRLETARALYNRDKVQLILVSGDNRTRHYNETKAMRRWLVKRGVPADDIYSDYAGFRTFDTMERAARVFEVPDAIICTQTFHLYRSVFLARRAGIDAVGMVSDLREYRRARRDQAREYLARSLAFLDTYLLGTDPHFLGPTIPITGPPQGE